MSLNSSIKFEFYKNRRDSDFISEDDFDQHTFQSFIQNYDSRKKNNMNLNLFLQDFDKQEKEIINIKLSSQVAVSKAKINNFFDEKIIQIYLQTEFQFDEKILITINFMLKLFLNNDN